MSKKYPFVGDLLQRPICKSHLLQVVSIIAFVLLCLVHFDVLSAPTPRFIIRTATGSFANFASNFVNADHGVEDQSCRHRMPHAGCKTSSSDENFLNETDEIIHDRSNSLPPIASTESHSMNSSNSQYGMPEKEGKLVKDIDDSFYAETPRSGQFRTYNDSINNSEAKSPQSGKTTNESSIEERASKTKAEIQAIEEDAAKRSRMGKNSSISGEKYPKEATCDGSIGKWVKDESYPIYRSENCPFLDGGFRCQENGRPDSSYLKWRWQPSQCNIPRFNAKDMLQRIRGGRVVYVGDSIGRNQWESMVCMLAEAVQNKSHIYEENGSSITKHTGFLSFRFDDYNCTVEYYRSPFLVPPARPPKGSPEIVKRVLRIDSMDWMSPRWKGADILIFNAGHWWSYEKTLKGGCYFQDGSTVNLTMGVEEAFQKTISTWTKWVDSNLDTQKSQVFFRSYSPSHFRYGTWKSGGRCDDESEPSSDDELEVDQEEPWTSRIVSEAISRNKRHQISFLNITHLTEYRKDGHASIWNQGPGAPPAPKNRQDCSHWCLPGVPDTWNELLYAMLLAKAQGTWATQLPSHPTATTLL